MRKSLALVVLLVFARHAAGDPPAPAPKPGEPAPPSPPSETPALAAKSAQEKPLTPEQAADDVLAAVKARDDAALKALAAKDDPDPWLVADELLARGGPDAAEAFARAAPRPDVEKLPAYVAARRGRPDDAAARGALRESTAAFAAGKPAEALALAESSKAREGSVLAIRLVHGRGLGLSGLRRLEEGGKAFAEAAEMAERIGWLRRAGALLHAVGESARRRSDFRAALSSWDRETRLAEARGDRAAVALASRSIGSVQYLLGNYARALEAEERALTIEEGLGDRGGILDALVGMGIAHGSLGNSRQALACHERALKIAEEMGDRRAVALTLGNIGLVHWSTGDYGKALDCQQKALRIEEQLGDPEGPAYTLRNIGLVHWSLGDYAKALEDHERALRLAEGAGDRAHAAMILGNIGTIHTILGDFGKALQAQERALALEEGIGDRAGVAMTLGNIGIVHNSLGDYAKALEWEERALRLKEELGDRVGIPQTVASIGSVYYRLEDYPHALEHFERALKLEEALGDRAGAARIHANIGNVFRALRDYPKALEHAEGALAVAEELGLRDLAVRSRRAIAETHLLRGAPGDAAAAARLAVEEMSGLVHGLSEEQGARARGEYADLFEIGVRAGLALGDAEQVSFFLESGRAGTLLETLGGRASLWATALPEEVRDAETDARTAESAALAEYRKALGEGDRAAISSRRARLDAARAGVQDVAERIQREAKSAASLLYPRAAELGRIREWVGPDSALVLYGLLSEEAVALVVTAKEGRLVRLGRTAEIEAACAALLQEDEAGVKPTLGAQPAARLRELVVDSLKLDPGVTRLLVSPDGALSYVPFSLLAAGRDVAAVPSGTTYGLLLGDRTKRGEGVLALGDPDYRTKVDERAIALNRGGLALLPLPGTREEARAIGDTILLGADATEANLRAAGEKKRWHAVHLACHGLVDPGRPMLSSLAVTAAADDDGFLTALDVFRMRMPADLVVLSACETGKGRVFRTEGIVGLTRAFMFAGAPRVICSLWKVDDDATRALMVKFYSLWSPKDGSTPMGTATALRAAQQFVRSQEKWKHPYYWAAWVLWGLAD